MTKPCHKDSNGHAIVFKAQHDECIKMWKTGRYRKAEIGRKLNISSSYVCEIVNAYEAGSPIK